MKHIKEGNWPTFWNGRSNKLYVHINAREKRMQLCKDGKLLKLFLRAYSVNKAKPSSSGQQSRYHLVTINNGYLK